MKSCEYLPTDENIVNSFLNDYIDRDKDIIAIVRLLDSIESNFSIVIDSKWGNGKTFFVKQIKKVFEVFNDFIEYQGNGEEKRNIKNKSQELWNHYVQNGKMDLQKHMVVYYDAWENDDNNEPVLSLILSIIEEFKDLIPNLNLEEKDINIKFNDIIAFFCDNLSKLISTLSETTDLLKEAKSNNNLKYQICDFLSTLKNERADRIIIIIDELDRCNPSYAIRLLERIKHYFNLDFITFVFTANLFELTKTIKNYYGCDFNSLSYLDRFFDLRINLPEIETDKFYNFIDPNKDNYSYENICKQVAKHFKLSMREFTRFYNTCKFLIGKISHNANYFERDSNLSYFKAVVTITPIIVALKICDLSEYNKFINGQNSKRFVDVYRNETQWFRELFNDADYSVIGKNSADNIIENRLKDFYNAVFNYDPKKAGHIILGHLEFYMSIKNEIIRISEFLSNYVELN